MSDRTPLATFFDNRYLLALAAVVTLVAGLSAIRGLPRLEDPVITNRNPQVITVFPGASAERVEALVTEKLEQELDEVDEIKFIESSSRAGISTLNIELLDTITDADLDPISSELRDKVAAAAATFPPEVVAPIYDDKRNAVAYTLIVAVKWRDPEAGAGSLGILSRRAEDLADRLRAVPGTELARTYGDLHEEVRVTFDPARLAERGVTPGQLAAALERADAKVPAGQLRGPRENLLVEVEGRLDSLDRVREVIVLQDQSRAVRVGDLATVERAWEEPPAQLALSDGDRAIFVAARVVENERVDLWDAAAAEVLERFNRAGGDALEVDVIFRQSDYTSERLASLAGNLLLGSLVVVAVIFATMGWRRALIVGSALPLTAAATLFAISLRGGQLHQMSIFGMIIALGLLIDTAIVVTDEVRKGIERGHDRRRATIAALRHLFVPLLASTLTSVLAFMPILLLPGGAGDFVGSIGGSVITAISLSFALSVTVIAAMAGIFSKPPRRDGRGPAWLREGLDIAWFNRAMRHLVGFAIRRPLAGIAVGAALPVAGFLLATTLGSQFFPRTDRDMFTVEIELPSVSSIDRSVATAREAEAIIRSCDGIERVHWLAGASFPPVYYNLIEDQDRSPEYVMGVVDADRFETVDAVVPRLQRQLAERFPRARVQVAKFAQGPPADSDIEVRLLGPSIPELQRLGDEIQRRLGEHPRVTQAESSLTRGEPKLWFDADEAEARAAGIELGDLAGQLQGNLEGLAGGSVLEAVEEMPVRVRVDGSRRDELATIADLRLIGGDGAALPLRALGEFRLKPESGAITRRNGERVNHVRGWVETGALAIDITNEVLAELENEGFRLPPGYRMELGGESENQSDAVGNLMLYLPVIVTLTLAILILSFRSVRVAGILLGTAGLAIGYGLFATWTMQFPLSFNTILGCIGLVGLAFNDSIVALAAIHANPAAKRGEIDAMVEEILGCGRHLISTTLTTIGSFLPLLILIGGQFWPPLAIVLAGGVGGATLLAATFTPAAYRLLVARKYRPRESRAPVAVPQPA